MIIDSPIVSGSQLASGPFTQIGNVQITGSLSVTGPINGSITGSVTSASYATYAETASYAVGYALDNNVVHLSGNQSIAGEKSFENVVTIYESSAVRFTDNPITTTYGSIIGNSSFWQFTAGADTLLFRSKNSVNALSIDANGNSTMTSVTANSFTGSLLGTASYATNANNTSASFAAYSASVSTRLTTDEANITTLTSASGSFAAQSASLSTRITQDETNFTNLSSSFATTSGSLSTRVTNLESTSSTVSSSFASTSGSIAGRVTLIEGQYATTGSNVFTGPQFINEASNAIGFTSTASLYTPGGARITKDLFVSGTSYFNNVVVYGTSSIQYITSSQVNFGTNIITVNTDTPAVRFGGLAVFDSGSTQLTGSMLWDSERNHWIYSNPSGSTYNSAMLMNGPRNTGSLGSEQGTTACALMMGQGGDHITSSAILHYGNATCIPNTLVGSTICTTMLNASCVGIGTTTPCSALHVATGPNTDGIFLGRVAACTNKHAIFLSADQSIGAYIAGGTNPDGTATQADGAGRLILQGGQTEGFQFQTSCVAGGAAQSWQTRLKIFNSGIACFACQVCAPAFVGGTVNGTTGTFTGNIVTTGATAEIMANGAGSSNSVGGSSRFTILDSLNTRGWILQQNASYNLSFWHFNGGWSNVINFTPAGGATFSNDIAANGNLTLNSGGDRIIGINDTAGNSFQIQAASNILYYSARTSGGSLAFRTNGTNDVKFNIAANGAACFACELTAKTLGTNDLILNNLNYECANYVDGTRGSWLIQEGACDLFIINQVSCKKYKFNLIEIK